MLPAFAEGGQGVGLRRITMDDGLASNAVRNIVQDRAGFVWFGTDNGLCRYDGVRMQPFRIVENGIDQYVSALCDAGDSLVVGTARGVFSFDHRTERFRRIVPEQKGTVTHLAYDKGGNLWVATAEQGAWLLPASGGKAKHYAMDILHGGVSSILVTDDNQIIATSHSTHPSLARLNKVNDRFELLRTPSAADHSALATLQTADGTVWVGTWNSGLMRLDADGKLQQVASAAGPSFRHIHTLHAYSPDCILIGCDEGLLSFNPQTGQVGELRSRLPIPQDFRFVYSVLRDREGGLWVGSFYGGVAYVSPTAGRFDGVAGGVIARFCEDSSGRVWVASDDGGLRLYSPSAKAYVGYAGPDWLRRLNAHALCMDGTDLWVGTYTAGVVALDTRTGQVRSHTNDGSPDGLGDNSSYAIHRDRKGRIWVGTMRGVSLYDKPSGKFRRVKELPVVTIDIDDDAQGNLWFSTQGDGLHRLDAKGKWHSYKNSANPASLADNQVNSVCLASGGQLWVATAGGLCRYDYRRDRFERVKLDIPRPAVSSVVEEQGVLWLSTECGVVKYEPTTGVCRFTKLDGLLSEQFQPNAGLKTSDGHVYFGTTVGFNVFSPYQVKMNSVAPPVFITSLELFNRRVEVGSGELALAPAYVPQIDLSWRDEMFSLTFASLSYCSPTENQYAYKLEGFDKEWNYVGAQQEATYTNIPAGTYTFRVKATNNDGLWSDGEATVKIVVHPPFWWSLPAKILYVALALSLLYYYVHIRLRRAERRHRREMEKLRDEKEREVREARLTFFTMIAHEIRTPVSLIIGPLESVRKACTPAIAADLGVIDRNAHRLLELVNQLLDFRKVEQQKLVMHFAPCNVCDMVRAVTVRFEPTFKQGGKAFAVTLPDSHFTAILDREAITKVISNLLTNANKYTKDDVRLLCAEEPDGQHLRIEVADNGVGIAEADRERIFAPFYQAQGNKPGTGIGLSIVKNIVTQHGGTIGVESQVGRGSTFTVVLPVTQAVVEEAPALPEAKPSEAPTPVSAPAAARPDGAAKPKPTLLVVDDSEDMVAFLRGTFEADYRVVTAGDGIEALDRLKRLQNLADERTGEGVGTVSLIVCDWMMPRMDGAELCRRVRQDKATSHIPFVMLTAKTDSAAKVEGMDVGADAYIEKPFSVDYLKAAIRGILDMRRRLRERFATQPLEPATELASNATDDDFMRRLTQVIEDNFSNADLSVKFLAEQMDMSRSSLFAKIKSLGDLTPNEMIQVVRLKKAAQLLRDGRHQVGEVGYMVGFSNPSYFSKCFAKQFGMRPGDFLRQVQNDKK